jgi:hypothetical protein
MPDLSYRPKSAVRAGALFAFLRARQPTSLTVNTTTDIPGEALHRKAFLVRLSVATHVVPADSDGTITAIVYKYDASAAAAVALCAAVDLETLTAKVSSAVTITSTLTEAERTFDEGDYLYAVATNNSAAINTQPSGLTFTAEMAIKE